MATVSQDNINDIVDALEMELSDIDYLVALGRTSEQLISTIAPQMLDYINSFLFAMYEAQESPLESQTLTILTWLCIAEVLYLAYRRSVISEKEWADEWHDRAIGWLEMIAKGQMALSSPTRQSNYTPKFDAENRQFCGRDTSGFDNTNIVNTFDLFGVRNTN